MFDISNNGIITITRGDSAVTNMIINLGTELQPDIFDASKYPSAKVYFGLMEPNCPFEKAILKKVFTTKDFVADELGRKLFLRISFSPEDTESLIPGVYYYSIKLWRPATDLTKENAEQVDSVISKRRFVIVD